MNDESQTHIAGGEPEPNFGDARPEASEDEKHAEHRARLDGHDEVLADHHGRLAAIEGAMGISPEEGHAEGAESEEEGERRERGESRKNRMEGMGKRKRH